MAGKSYVRIKPNGMRAFWAIKRKSSKVPDIFVYTKCNALGVVGKRVHLFYLTRDDYEYERPARINMHYAELETIEV